MDPLLRHGIELFNRQEFFECHEVLEEAWTPERGPRRLFLQSLIHMAVACYHCQRGNVRGACGQFTKGLQKMQEYLPVYEDVDLAALSEECQAVFRLVKAGGEAREFPRIRTMGTPATRVVSNEV